MAMENALLWGYVHMLLFVFWFGTDLGVFAAMACVKNPSRSLEARKALLRIATQAHVLPRICFALILPTGVELTSAINVYPLTSGLRAASWIIGAVWVLIILVGARTQGKALSANLRIVELVFHAFAGLIFLAYGLNSLATGAPIDEEWFAAKLFLFGLVFWASIAADVGFRPFFLPFNEIALEGSTPEREEDISAAVNHALAAMAALYLLIAAIAIIGKVRPF
jgi:hypothetical protein